MIRVNLVIRFQNNKSNKTQDKTATNYMVICDHFSQNWVRIQTRKYQQPKPFQIKKNEQIKKNVCTKAIALDSHCSHMFDSNNKIVFVFSCGLVIERKYNAIA